MKSEKLKITVIALTLLMNFCLAGIVLAQGALDKAEILFLQKKYWQAIEECTAVIQAHPNEPEVLSKANYIAGAGYINIFDFLTGKKSFMAIIAKYKNSAYYEDAYIALGDVEMLQENYKEALSIYAEFYRTNPSKKRLATLYFRLAEVNLKLNNDAEFKKYLSKLREEFPDSFEAKDSRRLEGLDTVYTVQVGAFADYDNAEKFIQDLKAKGYDVYSVLCMLSGKKLCRIRVGKLNSRAEAEELKKRLEKDGYFAKIYP